MKNLLQSEIRISLWRGRARSTERSRAPFQWSPLARTRARLLIASLGTGAVLLTAPPTLALDGLVDVTDNRQSARRGDETLDTFSRRDALSLSQRFQVSSRFLFDLRFRRTREISGTRSSGQGFDESERVTHQPSFLLNYDQSDLRVGLTGSWQDRSTRTDTGPGSDHNRYQFGAVAEVDPTKSTDVNLSWKHSVTEESGGVEEGRMTREQSGLLRLKQQLPGPWNLGYRYSARSSNLVERDTRQVFQSHLIEIAGNPSSDGGAFTSSLRARTQLFRQETEVGTSGLGRVLLIPLTGGLTLDDTPEVLDPLEDDPVEVPGLFDGDLDGATPVNIGDAAAAVREFGGDYRNLQFDFGESVQITGATLYVDERILLPELFEWLVFVTDDPEGRLWTEVRLGEVAVAYAEFGGVRQGWEIRFVTVTSARYFKLVDVKLGETVPNLFVTELEVYREDIDGTDRTLQDSQSHRLDASFGYELFKGLRFGSQTSLRRRSFDDNVRGLDEVTQAVSSQWSHRGFLLSGHYGIHRLWSDVRRNTDLVDYSAAARQKFGDRFLVTLSWSQTDDQSTDLSRTTESVAMTTSWRPTRRLRISQRLSRSKRRDQEFADESTSMVASTTVQGSPIATVSINLVRTDRWVNHEAGSGFDRFNDTTLSTSWVPVPLISLSSHVAYQERIEREWVVRNSLGWAPLPGGDVEVRFSGSTFSDTRTDNTRYSAEVGFLWKVHSRVKVEGSVESARVKFSGETTAPVGSRVHLLWAF